MKRAYGSRSAQDSRSLVRTFASFAVVLALGATTPAAFAQTVSGRAFEDRDGDGVHDPGEPGVEGVTFELFGQSDGTGAVDADVASAADGTYQFDPGAGCYVLAPVDPPGWRASVTRSDLVAQGAPGYTYPAGIPRVSKFDQGIAHLRSGALDYAGLGDSIAFNFNFCGGTDFWYSRETVSRLQCVAPAASVTLDEAAVKGEHTDDLMVDDGEADGNNVFAQIQRQPDRITISMIGNDLLDVDAGNNPTQEQVNTAVSEVLDARQNLQEALSTMVSEIPGADISLNSLYDNLAYDCYGGTPTSDFHRTWVPIVNRILREVAWGQARRVAINEAAAEFGSEDLNGVCSGYPGQICRDFFGLDDIHPTEGSASGDTGGYEVILEKVWEATGGIHTGARDIVGRTQFPGTDYGFLRRVRRLYPTRFEARDGAVVQNPEAALAEDDGGATATIALGSGTEEFRLDGFPDWFDEVRIVKVVAGVEYRTTGTFANHVFRIEAAPTGTFRPPAGFAYAPTNWNFYTPIVGGGGRAQPPENPDYDLATMKILAVPDVSSPRVASATLTKNPTLAGGASGYAWPAISHDDLATTAIRVVAATDGADAGTDPRVELDVAWLDVYGYEVARPDEVAQVRVDRAADGTLDVSFDAVPSAQRYNLYFGRLAAVRSGGYDHGDGAPVPADCDASTGDPEPGRKNVLVATGNQPAEDAYFLVTAHVDDVETPSGADSDGDEIDRSQSVCR